MALDTTILYIEAEEPHFLIRRQATGPLGTVPSAANAPKRITVSDLGQSRLRQVSAKRELGYIGPANRFSKSDPHVRIPGAKIGRSGLSSGLRLAVCCTIPGSTNLTLFLPPNGCLQISIFKPSLGMRSIIQSSESTLDDLTSY